MKFFFQLLFLLSFNLLFQSCGSEDDIPTPEIPEVVEANCTDGLQNGNETGVDCGGDCDLCGPPTNASSFFYALVDNGETTVKSSNAVGGGGCGDYRANGGGWVKDLNTFELYAGVTLVRYFAEFPDSDEWYSMFQAGEYSYGNCDDNVQGAEIEWLDENNVAWFSAKGDQTGSTFTITERGPQSSNGLSSYCKGTFSCKVYNENGDVKSLEGGQFRMSLGLF